MPTHKKLDAEKSRADARAVEKAASKAWERGDAREPPAELVDALCEKRPGLSREDAASLLKEFGSGFLAVPVSPSCSPATPAPTPTRGDSRTSYRTDDGSPIRG
jgi:hypothetical protein